MIESSSLLSKAVDDVMNRIIDRMGLAGIHLTKSDLVVIMDDSRNIYIILASDLDRLQDAEVTEFVQ